MQSEQQRVAPWVVAALSASGLGAAHVSGLLVLVNAAAKDPAGMLAALALLYTGVGLHRSTVEPADLPAASLAGWMWKEALQAPSAMTSYTPSMHAGTAACWRCD